MTTALLIVTIALAAAPVPATAPPAHDPDHHEFQFVALPIASVNVDEGFGGGLVAALYHYYGGVAPMRDDLSLRLFITSKLVQRHELRWEGREVFDLPLRLWLRVALFSTVTQAYCGLGDDAGPCDLAHARSAADDAGFAPSTKAYDQFARHYYAMRYVRPSADTLWRWRLLRLGGDEGATVEAMAGWRLAWYRPGDFFHEGPYPGSLYAQEFPEGEPGVSSLWQLGFTIDHRDFEPSPTRGYFWESSVRASAPWWGSAWTYAGANAALSTYTPLSSRVTLANRALVDVLQGDVPTAEIGETGGTHDHAAFGGQWIGRGVRDRHYIGKVKLIDQIEARTELFDFTLFGFNTDVAANVFVDAGVIAPAMQQLDQAHFLYGAGVGLRFLLQHAIAMRIDVAGSPYETQQPSFYTPVGFPF